MGDNDFFELLTMKLFLWIVAMIIVLLSMFTVWQKINNAAGLENDNPIEESIEDIIEQETGVSLDLTPEE